MSNLLSKASILLTPTATSNGKLHNVKPNTTTGDFTFTRATTATRVNSNGLIESVASGLPRIDFTGGTGQVLLEPASTNASKNSENTSSWTYIEFGSGSAGTITTGKTDMFGGTNAVQIDFPADAENVAIRFGQTTSSISSGTVTMSIYAKLVQSGSKTLRFRANTSQNLVIDSTEFVRYEATVTKGSSEAFSLKLRPSQGTSSGGFSIILCHPQEEAQSFATSYIPTTGTDATRNKDEANSAGDTSLINSTEGVLYAEISALADDTIQRAISLSNSTIQNTVEIFYNSGSNQLSFRIRANNTNVTVQNRTVSDRTQFIKVALKYKSGDIEGFINGVKEVDRTDSFTFSGNLSELAFDRGGAQSFFEGKIKTIAVFKEALTDAQLISLTS